MSAACGGGGDHTLELPDGAPPDMPARDGGLVEGDTSLLTDGGPDAPDGSVADAGPPPVPVPRPMETVDFNWKACADTLQCGYLYVPIDYEHPENGTLKVALMRRLATGVRAGALFVDPGGPGESAIDFLGNYVQDAPTPLFDRFDLIAVDPRGVGYSTPVTCHDTLQALTSADPEPQTDADWALLDGLYAQFAEDCSRAQNANLLPFIGTANVARDFDAVRAGLGEDKLDYLGYSYGTAIGAWYAELFPNRTGRLVLDGAEDLGQSPLDHALEQAKGFELALQHYFDWCSAYASRCSWAANGDPAKAFANLLALSKPGNFPAPKADRPMGPGDFLTAVAATMYGGAAGWRALSPALDDMLKGDASKLMTFVDGYLDRNADGSYPNFQEMFFGVSCIDQASPSVAEIRAQAAKFTSEAPTFGLWGLSTLLICPHWAAQGKDVPSPTGKGAAALLVVGSINDPATPYRWAQAMATQLVSATLLTSDLEGHTSYERGDPCIDDAVDAYLFNGVLPAASCAGAMDKSIASIGPAEVQWPRASWARAPLAR